MSDVNIYFNRLFQGWKRSLLWAGPITFVFAWANAIFPNWKDLPQVATEYIPLYWLPLVLSLDVIFAFIWWFFRRKS